MKKVYFLLIIIQCSLVIANAQVVYRWYETPSGVSTNLNYITGSSEFYIVGDNGVVLFRNYSGTIFQRQTGTNSNLFNYFISNSPTYIQLVCGSNGTMLQTSNGGVNWLSLNTGVSNTLYSINRYFQYPAPFLYRIICAGSEGKIIASTNDGVTWTSVNSPVSTDLKSVISFINTNPTYQTGFIFGNNGVILKTTDAGISWNIIPSGVIDNLNSAYFRDINTGWVVGNNGRIIRTSDGGNNWSVQTSGISNDLNSTRGGIAGNNGTVLYTTNSGVSWIKDTTNVTTNLKSIIGVNSTLVFSYVVGEGGKIYFKSYDSSYFPFFKLNGNRISSWFYNRGIFDQDFRTTNTPGFEWPKDSGKFAIFTTGLTTAALLNNSLRMASCSYAGEYKPGYCVNGSFLTDNRFKFYKVKRGDNAGNNSDWANWGQMVPFGAPFIDVNNNGIYEPAIDTPGVRNASQTLFICLTDSDPNSHTPGEGFGGGTAPLYAELHLTAWCYSQPSYCDMQFVKFEMINKGLSPWMKTFFSFTTDTDIGNANDDYIGCDTVRNLGYGYNGDNDDEGGQNTYGINPPAAGMLMLKGARNKYSVPPVNLKMTSLTQVHTHNAPCEDDPNGLSNGAYLFMKGYKMDSTCWFDPTQNPPKRTKCIYAGDPETNIGWTQFKGSMLNCNGDTTGEIIPVDYKGDKRFVQSTGSENLTVMPGDTQLIIMCQLIARGTSNLNSVTKLKQLADIAINFYNTNFTIGINTISTNIPQNFMLYQNYPNPFNAVTKIRFDVSGHPPYPPSKGEVVALKVFDIIGREIQTLVNEQLQSGTYEVTFDGTNLPSGIYFYKLVVNGFNDTKTMVLIK
jgi:photosystem II stability/assembly factor-like uncharacterized protein